MRRGGAGSVSIVTRRSRGARHRRTTRLCKSTRTPTITRDQGRLQCRRAGDSPFLCPRHRPRVPRRRRDVRGLAEDRRRWRAASVGVWTRSGRVVDKNADGSLVAKTAATVVLRGTDWHTIRTDSTGTNQAQCFAKAWASRSRTNARASSAKGVALSSNCAGWGNPAFCQLSPPKPAFRPRRTRARRPDITPAAAAPPMNVCLHCWTKGPLKAAKASEPAETLCATKSGASAPISPRRQTGLSQRTVGVAATHKQIASSQLTRRATRRHPVLLMNLF